MKYPYMGREQKNVNDLNQTSIGSQARTDAPAPPEPRNEGGNTAISQVAAALPSGAPRLVTRGESYGVYETDCEDGESYILVVGKFNKPQLIRIPKPKLDGVPNAAIIDWLNCSFSLKPNFSLDSFFGTFLPILGRSFSPAKDRGRGCHGYTNSIELGASKAMFAYGGNRGTGLISFSGESCHQIPNWTNLIEFLAVELSGRITRVDLAHDDIEGRHTVDHAIRMYQEGLFLNGGRDPQMDQRGNWLKPDGRGRTLYIGSSKNGKMLRIYEKGMQLGAPYHPWVRWELQLGSKDREIPWETLTEPGKYLAGSYPNALSWISEEQSRIRTLQKNADLSYSALTHFASVGYGKLIDTMMQVEGSAERVVEILRRDGLPARLNLPELPIHGKIMP
jgi:phage replication initiation protein